MDFTGKKMHIVDPETGEIEEVESFVAILGASQLTYVEFVRTQSLPDWIWVNENAIRYFGGATRGLTPDNIKAIKEWNKKFTKPFSEDDVQTALRLSGVVDKAEYSHHIRPASRMTFGRLFAQDSATQSHDIRAAIA